MNHMCKHIDWIERRSTRGRGNGAMVEEYVKEVDLETRTKMV